METSLISQDQAYIWHPFTQMQTAKPPIPIIRAEGVYLYDQEGRQILDAISSWWTNLHGHAHPYIANAIKEQANQLDHVIFADFTHQPAVELATRLISILPRGMSKIFYSDNGSTAVEVALKIAFQYWHNRDPNSKRIKVICFKGGYHGDTFGAMSAAGKNEFNKPFWRHIFEVDAIDPPIEGHEEASLLQLESILKKGESACFIFEPLVMGSGGMIIYPPAGLDALMLACRKHGVLTIADEVMTGFGRTGTLFAEDQLAHSADMICLSKGLTGGFLPLGVTACTQAIFDAFLDDSLQKAFLHGHTYTAYPLACRSALASLDLLQTDHCELQRQMIARCHQNFCLKWKGHSKLARCQTLGTILALEYCQKGEYSYFQPIRDTLYGYFMDRGILLRPLGNVLYILPPYCITENELQYIYDQIAKSIEGGL